MRKLAAWKRRGNVHLVRRPYDKLSYPGMCMITSPARLRKGASDLDDGYDAGQKDTQENSTSDGNIFHTIHAEPRRAEGCAGTPAPSAMAHCPPPSDDESCVSTGKERCRAIDEAMLSEAKMGRNSTQRVQVVVRIRPAKDASAAR